MILSSTPAALNMNDYDSCMMCANILFSRGLACDLHLMKKKISEHKENLSPNPLENLSAARCSVRCYDKEMRKSVYLKLYANYRGPN